MGPPSIVRHPPVVGWSPFRRLPGVRRKRQAGSRPGLLLRLRLQRRGPQPCRRPHAAAPAASGYGSKSSHQTTGFSRCFHLPGYHFGYLFLTHDLTNPDDSVRARGPILRVASMWLWVKTVVVDPILGIG